MFHTKVISEILCLRELPFLLPGNTTHTHTHTHTPGIPTLDGLKQFCFNCLSGIIVNTIKFPHTNQQVKFGKIPVELAQCFYCSPSSLGEKKKKKDPIVVRMLNMRFVLNKFWSNYTIYYCQLQGRYCTAELQGLLLN